MEQDQGQLRSHSTAEKEIRALRAEVRWLRAEMRRLAGQSLPSIPLDHSSVEEFVKPLLLGVAFVFGVATITWMLLRVAAS